MNFRKKKKLENPYRKGHEIERQATLFSDNELENSTENGEN